jgi:crotonyl-CoA carboxylase/reductase
MPKPPELTWEEAAASTLVGSTAYRMLFGWSGNTLREGDVVLIWGGAGGVGSQAIELARWAGARPIAVTSDSARGEYCVRKGAIGYINRHAFSHWGPEPSWADLDGQRSWLQGAQAFGKRLWEICGERTSPAIVVEHPGEATLATSVFVCEPGGMVVICAGTTGYSPVLDLRYLWTRQKRVQGSHGTNDEQAQAYNKLVTEGAISPSLGDVRPFEAIPALHQDMLEGRLQLGNSVALVGATEPGHGRSG